MPKSKDTNATSENPHFYNAKTRAILNGLILQKLAGKKAESGFKPEAWNDVTKDYNKLFKCGLVKKQLKNHFQTVSSCSTSFFQLSSNLFS
jgi:hypothetical protein